MQGCFEHSKKIMSKDVIKHMKGFCVSFKTYGEIKGYLKHC